MEKKALQSEFISKADLPKIFFTETNYVNNTSKGKIQMTLSMNEKSRKALNDYVQKNPHFLSERVKAMGMEVLGPETEQKMQNLTDENQKLQELITQLSNNQQSDGYNNSQIETLRNNYSDLQKKLEDLQAEKNKLVLNLQENQNKNSILLLNKQEELSEITQKLESKSNEIFKLSNCLKNLEQEKDKENIRLKNTVKNLESNQAELTRLNDEVSQLKESLRVERLKHDTLEQEKNALNASMEELVKNYESQKVEANQELATLKQNATDFNNQLDIGRMLTESYMKSSDKKDKEFAMLKELCENLKTEKEGLEKKNDDINSKYEKTTTENDRLKRAFFGSMFANLILIPGSFLFFYRHLIKNGFVSLWQLIPSVSFKKPNISFPTFSNPFSNFQIGNQIALHWALLRNRFGV